MKSRTPAIILALTVFPGAGHFYLKKKARGAFWAVSTCLLLGILIIIFEKELFHQAMQSGASLHDLKNLLFKVWVSQKTNFISLLLGTLLLWIGSIVDLLLLKSEKNKNF